MAQARLKQPIRQGDVLLVPVDGLPKNVTEVKGKAKKILALGEVTGHSHHLEGKFARFAPDDIPRAGTGPVGPIGHFIMTGDDPVTLFHDEHDKTLLEPNTIYEQVYQYEGATPVVD